MCWGGHSVKKKNWTCSQVVTPHRHTEQCDKIFTLQRDKEHCDRLFVVQITLQSGRRDNLVGMQRNREHVQQMTQPPEKERTLRKFLILHRIRTKHCNRQSEIYFRNNSLQEQVREVIIWRGTYKISVINVRDMVNGHHLLFWKMRLEK